MFKKYFKVKNSEKEIKISVGYELGGYNNWNGQTNARGYYIYVQPVERKDNGGWFSESYVLFDGYKFCVEQVGRKSQKVADKVEQHANENARLWAEQYCLKNGLVLEV